MATPAQYATPACAVRVDASQRSMCLTLDRPGSAHRPFGSLPGFETNLGIVSVPQAPIGGYIYKDGTGDDTTWQLYAEAVYL